VIRPSGFLPNLGGSYKKGGGQKNIYRKPSRYEFVPLRSLIGEIYEERRSQKGHLGLNAIGVHRRWPKEEASSLVGEKDMKPASLLAVPTLLQNNPSERRGIGLPLIRQ